MKNKITKYFNLFAELGKVKITFFVAISSSVGYILASGSLTWHMILPALGIFILASSSSALNHFQERDLDALMDRTKNRPIPSGRVSPDSVLLFSLLLFIIGSLVLLLSSNTLALSLGWLAFVWYNIIYTPLKRKYALAVVPGSVIGALPPIIGWVAGGGDLFNPQIIALALFFFIWQVPHFWLLLLLYGKDYDKAGFPTLTKIFNTKQIARLTFMWVVALSTSCLLIPFFGVSKNIFTSVGLILLGIWLVLTTAKILSEYVERKNYRNAFVKINIYVLTVVILLSLDKLILIQF